MSTNTVLFFVSFILPFVLVMLSEKVLLRVLVSLGFKQKIREDGPSWHKNKENTPTAGGIVFFSIIVFVLLFVWGYCSVNSINVPVESIKLIIFVITFGGAIGFLDDYIKKVFKHNEGLKPRQKLMLQIFLSVIVALQLGLNQTNVFGHVLELNTVLYAVFIFCVIAGAQNAVNFTDGIDGLASTISGISYLGLALYLFKFSSSEYNTVLALVSVIMAGLSFGFLTINKQPAKVFMGDTGSLLLGSGFAILGLLGGIEWYLFLLLFIPIVEVFSVIIQVLSAKLSRKFMGRDIRPFKMTPLHHHFELSKWSEKKIILVFSIIQVFVILIPVAIQWSNTIVIIPPIAN